MSETLLITGFEPFGGDDINPSAEIAKTLDGQTIGRFRVVGRVISLDYTRALDEVRRYLAEHRPSVILACGQGNRDAICLEKIAINAIDTSRSDNYGNTPENDLIVPDGPAGYFTLLDVHHLLGQLKKNEIPAIISYHAGTYGCNWLFYNLMHWITTGTLNAKAGFIHVPLLPSQAEKKDGGVVSSMSLDVMLDGIKIIIENL